MFSNFAKMMKLAGEMKTKLPEMQEKLANSEYTAEAGGGAVLATVNGKMKLVDIEIGPALSGLNDGDPDADMLADLIKAAVSAAQEKAATAAKEAMHELTGGMEIPGLGDMM